MNEQKHRTGGSLKRLNLSTGQDEACMRKMENIFVNVLLLVLIILSLLERHFLFLAQSKEVFSYFFIFSYL